MTEADGRGSTTGGAGTGADGRGSATGGDGAGAGGNGSTTFCGLELAHPIVNASGTFDAIAARMAFGDELLERFPFAAFVTKTVTLQPRAGNPPPRLWELAGGLLNSIGLPNKGLQGFLASDLPRLADLPVPLIVNVMGSSPREFVQLVETIAQCEEVAALELNVSCPNVKTGLDIGADPRALLNLLGRVRPRTEKPLIVKLTPNTTDVAKTARAAEEAGADAVSLINTLRGMALAPGGDEPWLGGVTGGVSGPAVRAVALAQVYAVRRAVSVPIIGMGGVQNGRDALSLLKAGANLIAVGSESFRDPAAGSRIARQLAGLRPIPPEIPQTAGFSSSGPR
jgi:dihydroorotate dehydrogenase (NAD+) catalytic subunit